MANKKKCVWNGVKYESLTAASFDLGVSIACLIYRFNQGHTCDDDLQHTGYAQDFVRKSTIYNGITYPSRVDAARDNNITLTNLNYRLSKGYTCDNDGRKSIVWEGVEYPSIALAESATGISKDLLRSRAANNITSHADMDARGHKKKTTWNGIEYLSLTHAANALGISKQAMSQRIQKGYTCDANLDKRGGYS